MAINRASIMSENSSNTACERLTYARCYYADKQAEMEYKKSNLKMAVLWLFRCQRTHAYCFRNYLKI